MNNNYRIVWSDHRHAFVVTHEAAHGHGKPSATHFATGHLGQAVAAALMSLSVGQVGAACPSAVSNVITVSTATTSTCDLTGSVSLVITSGGSITSSSAVDVNGGTGGSIQNAGLLDGTADTAIHILNSGVLGSLTNTGTIHALSYGVLINNSGSLTGGLINSGLITAGDEGIIIETGSLGGGLINSGTIDSHRYGIKVESSTLSGGIDNSGLITTVSSSSIRIRDSVVTGGITNSGTIHAALTSYDQGAIDIRDSTVSGGITNSGLIQVVESSEWAYGINLDGTTLTGSIVNLGTIDVTAPSTSSGYGIRLNGTTVNGGITNTGLIQGGGDQTSSGYGIYLDGSSVSGAIVNSGTILGLGTSGGYGVVVNGSTLVGGITNSGRIEGSTTGISIQSSTLTGPINNLAGGTITGGSDGIVVDSGSTLTGGISNSGLIAGGSRALQLDNATDAFVIANSGTLQGDGHIGINTLNLNGSGSRVTGATVGTGTVNVNGTFTSENTFDVGTFNVASGGVFNIANGVTVGGGAFNNAGIVNVGATAQTITGDYMQSASGTYRFSLVDATSNYGTLHVTGNATLASGATVNVNVVGSPTLTSGTTVVGIIATTGALTATAANITVTDNSALYNFTAATVSSPGSALDLIISADRGGLPAAVVANNNSVALGAAKALQDLRNTEIPAAMQPVFDRLNNMTPEEASNAASQTLPTLIGAGSQAGINALHSMNKVIQSRVESSQGLSSGDGTSDRYMWGRAFGNWAEQRDHEGVSGFDSDTSGLVIGGDAPISPSMRAGAAFTYAKSKITSKSSLAPSRVDVDTFELVGYASYNIDPQTDINYQIDIGQNKASSNRRIDFMNTQASADFDSVAVHGSVGLGRVMNLSPQTNVTPSVRLDYTHMRTDGYTESGAGPLNLQVDAQTYREFLLTTDVKLAHQFEQGFKLIANGSVGYDFINKQAQTTAIFTGGGASFVTNGLDVSPWFYRLGLGLVKDDHKGIEYSVRYDLEGRTSGYLNQTLSAKVRWAF
jgi:outer membrane autotransporter protein